MSRSAQITSRKEPGPGYTREKLSRSAPTKLSVSRTSPRGIAGRGSLRNLPDKDLLARLEGLRGTERVVQLSILHHLSEIERRRLYLPMGYSSLFEFCVGHMGYSKSSAGRRIRAARCIDRFPQAAELLHSGESNLCALSMISGILTNENAEDILAQVRGRPLEDVEILVARHRPGSMILDRVKPVFVMNPCRIRGPGNTPGCINTPPEVNNANPDLNDGTGCKAGFESTPSTGSEKFPKCNKKFTGLSEAAEPERVEFEQRFKIEFAVEPEFMNKLNKIKSLLSTKFPKGIGLEDIFTILMEEYLDRHSPEGRIKKGLRREDSRKKRDIEKGKNAPDNKHPDGSYNKNRKIANTAKTGKKRNPATRTRHIPLGLRDKVFMRDGGRCTFIGSGGKRCGETRNLQIDHIIPYAKGGSNSPENLRLLCFKHNQHEAEREYGTKHMKKYNRRA